MIARRYLKVFSLLALVLLSAACKEELYSGLDERQANEMVAVLYANGIPATRTRTPDSLYTINVESSDLGPAIIFLDEAGLPRENFETIGQVFPAEGVVGTAFEEHVRYMYALSQELSQTVADIEGVHSARVHIMIPQRTRLQERPEESRASVAVYRTEEFDAQTSVPSIKTLVAYAVPGLSYENVAVATFSAGGLERIELEPAAPEGAAFASIGLFERNPGAAPVVSEPLRNLLIGLLALLLVSFLLLQALRGMSQVMRTVRGLFGRGA